MRRALVIEDEEYRRAWFRERYDTTITADVGEAIDYLKTRAFDVVFLDHDLGTEPRAGRDVAHWLIANPAIHPGPVIVHSLNTVSAEKMERELRAAGRDVQRIPFHLLLAATP